MREFGKYSIVSPIGSGGMAEVFLAKSYGAEGLEKRLVIKRILPEYANRPKFVSMFIDEAKVAVSLNHPNIVQVYEFGKVGSDYYLALEFVDGTDLGRVLAAFRKRRRQFGIGDAVYIAAEVAKALDYAHRKADEYGRPLSIVHRDVSPQNILLTWDGSVKLVDFGIAKARHTAGERSGVVKGKMSYMAPEQARGGQVDQRTDVFSLGAVFYEMLAGRAPFPRGKPDEVLALVRSGVIPDIQQFRSDLPEQLREIVDKSLARDPDQRYGGARGLQVDLTNYFLSVGTIHDAGRLADTLSEVRSELAQRAAETGEQGDPGTLVTAEDSAASTGGTLRETASMDTAGSTVQTANTSSQTEVPYFRERRETFVVVGELLGLTDLRGQLADDRWRSALFDYVHLVQSVGYKNHCAVDRVDERGFLLLAGVPVSSENDAEVALRVARELLEAVDAISINLPGPLQLTVGIAKGGMILERVHKGDEERFNWSADQPPWDTARRLAKHAMPGEILVDFLTQRRTRRLYEFSAIVESDVGQQEPVYRLERPKTHRQRLLERRKSFTTLHGRDFELRLLRQSFHESRRKTTVRTLVFLGDLGVGKATIVEEFLSGLEEDRVRIIRATCGVDDKDRPFAPVVKMLEGLLNLEPTGDLRARKRHIESALDELVGRFDADERRFIKHAVGLLFNVRYPDNVVEKLDPERRRDRMFLSLRRLLGSATRHDAAVLVVNDIQWADESSMAFLAEVASQRRKRPVLVVLTARAAPELLEGRHWKRLVQAKEVIIHQVGELVPQAARALIQDLLSAPMATHLVERIVERTGGNPLFIKEILESLIEEERLVESEGVLDLAPGTELELPATVEGIVAGRIGSLAPGPKVVLLRCSLIGREFDRDQLRTVFGEVPEGDLAVLVERGFIAQRAGIGGVVYRFTKGVTRAVAVKALVDEERAELHSRLAEHLIQRDSDLAEIDLAQVAKHLDAAGEVEDAGQYYLLAAANALDSSGLIEGLRLVDRALALLAADSEYRFTALDLKERLLKDLGRSPERQAVLGQLRAFVDDFGPKEHEVQVFIRTARYQFDQGEMETAQETVEAALALADEADDDRGRAAALTQLSAIYRSRGMPELSRDKCNEALAVYARIEAPPDEVAVVYNQLGILHHEDGNLEAALEAYEKVVELARQANTRSIEEVARINIGFCLVKMGELERAVNAYRQVLHEILQLGHRRNEAALLANLGHAQVLLGDYSRAEHTLRRCIRLSRRSEDAMRTADGLLTLAVAHLARGRLDDAYKALKPGLVAAESAQNNYLLCHGYLLSSELKLRRRTGGDIQAALDEAERVLELAADTHLFAFARAQSLRARCLLRMDRGAEAVEASRRALTYLQEGSVEGAESVLYAHALLMRKAGHLSEARAAIERAKELVDAMTARISSAQMRRTFNARRENLRVRSLYEELRDA